MNRIRTTMAAIAATTLLLSSGLPARAGNFCDNNKYILYVSLKDARQAPCDATYEKDCSDKSLTGRWVVTKIERYGKLYNDTVWDQKKGGDKMILLPRGAASCALNFTFDLKLDSKGATYRTDTGEASWFGNVSGVQAEAVYVELATGKANEPVKTVAAEKDMHLQLDIEPRQFPGKIGVFDPRRKEELDTVDIVIESGEAGTPG